MTRIRSQGGEPYSRAVVLEPEAASESLGELGGSRAPACGLCFGELAWGLSCRLPSDGDAGPGMRGLHPGWPQIFQV